MSRNARTRLLTVLMSVSGRAGFGALATRLAAGLTGPYKDRRVLAYLSERPYISPWAEIACPNLVIGRQVFIDDRVTLYAHKGGGRIVLGRGTHLYRNSVIEIGSGGSLYTGENAHIQGGCYLSAFAADIRIGAEVQIAPQCTFSPYRHNIDDLNRSMRSQGLSSQGDIVLEDDAWIGVGVHILDGVTVGRGAVIGAGAVVTHSIPPFAVAAGVPARVIGQRGRVRQMNKLS